MDQVIKDSALSLAFHSPRKIIKEIAARASARRLQLGWSRETLARRAGVSQWTLKHFETSGQVSLETLVKIAVVLDEVGGLASLFSSRPRQPTSIAELERLNLPPRRRGRTLR